MLPLVGFKLQQMTANIKGAYILWQLKLKEVVVT